MRSGSGYALKNAGRQLEADIVYWCTGGTPNTGFLKDGNADVLNASGYVKVSWRLSLNKVVAIVAYIVNNSTNYYYITYSDLAKGSELYT